MRSRRRTLFALAATLGLATVLPPMAVGATVTRAGETVSYQAAPGGQDRFFISSAELDRYIFGRKSDGAPITAGSGCSQASDDVVHCLRAGTVRIEVDLLDQDDFAELTFSPVPVNVAGGLGADLIYSGRGDDIVDGGSGNDTLADGSDASNDVSRGGPGDDRLVYPSGIKDASGGSGTDTFDASSAAEDLTISLDDAANDAVRAGGGSNIHSDVEKVEGGNGDDVLSAGPGPQALAGNSGADRLDGGAGQDVVLGNSGHDSIQARDGERDTIDCGPGEDRVLADTADQVTSCEFVLFDADRDGAATDTDCDDANAAIHPGAVDVPENGVDENCDGSELFDPDRDRDGVQRPADCRDDRSDIRPGAIDVPQNGINEDCIDGDADYPRISSIIRATFTGVPGGFTRFKSLRVVNARAGSTIRVTCRGRGCRLRKRDRTTKVRRDRASLDMTRRVRRLRLFRRTQVVVRVTQPRTIGALSRWRGRGPALTECSLRPGARRPQGCQPR